MKNALKVLSGTYRHRLGGGFYFIICSDKRSQTNNKESNSFYFMQINFISKYSDKE